jgi:hypothetical protein
LKAQNHLTWAAAGLAANNKEIKVMIPARSGGRGGRDIDG